MGAVLPRLVRLRSQARRNGPGEGQPLRHAQRPRPARGVIALAAERQDVVVIGGGIYGALGAALVAELGHGVTLVERAHRLLDAASAVNQARVHNGYHYPRSLPTATRSHANYQRFKDDFGASIASHECVYAIARSDSLVTAGQFQRFCSVVGIPLLPLEDPGGLVDAGNVAAAWRADEAVFDSDVLRRLVEARIGATDVDLRLDSTATGVELRSGEATVLTAEDELRASLVLDCSYGGLERMAATTDEPPPAEALTYELAEIAFVEVPEEIRGVGLTVMDGPFFSCIPAPTSGLHSFSHVRYTPHVAGTAGQFPWEAAESPPASRFELMRRDAARFAPWARDVVYVNSLFAVKAVPPKRERDDARPVVIRRSGEAGTLVSVLGGKLDNVYDFLSWLRRELT